MANERRDAPAADRRPRPPFPKRDAMVAELGKLVSNATHSSYITGTILEVLGGEPTGG